MVQVHTVPHTGIKNKAIVAHLREGKPCVYIGSDSKWPIQLLNPENKETNTYHGLKIALGLDAVPKMDIEA